MTQTGWWSRLSILAEDCRKRMSTGCSSPSTPRSQMAWVWGSPSAVRSSPPTRAGCVRRRTCLAERTFSSPFHPTVVQWRALTILRVGGYHPCTPRRASQMEATKEAASGADALGAEEPVVFVVDDDRAVRDSTKNLAESVGLRVQAFTTAQDFLNYKRPDVPACLVLDVRLPERAASISSASCCPKPRPIRSNDRNRARQPVPEVY